MNAPDANIVAIAAQVKPCAKATLNAWYAICIASGHGGGDNLLRAGRDRFVIGEPRALQNGALVGRFYRFVRTGGLTDIGGFKIGADGAVIDFPEAPAQLRALLCVAQAGDADGRVAA